MKWSVAYGETVLNIECGLDLRSEVLDEVVRHHTQLLEYVNKNPLFMTSYRPVKTSKDSPEIVRLMADAAAKCDVGPMAAVAGAFSELVGKKIQSKTDGFIVENGGDIYLKTTTVKTVGIHTTSPKFKDKIRFKVKPGETPAGICCSSSTVGHSVSFGSVDAVVAVADSSALADAAATAIANKVNGVEGIAEGIEGAKGIVDLRGVLIVVGDKLGLWGRLPEIQR
jgi:ApbE superfamily uncharacterized protein (UPF0280 family)